MRLSVQLFLTVLLAATATGGVLILGGSAFLYAEGERALWQEVRLGARELAALVTDDVLLRDLLAVRQKLDLARERYPGFASTKWRKGQRAWVGVRWSVSPSLGVSWVCWAGP